MFVLVYPNVYVCICSGVSGSVSSHFTIINYHQSRLLIYCVSGGLSKIEFFRCVLFATKPYYSSLAFSNMHSDSCV